MRRLAENRIYLLLAAVFALMACCAPRFLTWDNQTAIMKGMSLSVLPAIGFTLVTICGQLDLSIGTSLTLGGMLTIGLQPQLGWAGALGVAVLAGLAVGLLNGLLVAKAKVDSFIATLGAMIVTQGLVYIYCRGATLTVADFRLGDWLEQPWLPLLTPRVAVALALAAGFDALLRCTTVGRGFFFVGGNPSAAWNAGLPVDRYVIGAFALSGALSSLGGALFSASVNAAMPTMGNNALMEVIAAVIIGGTAMTGGRGSVVKSLAALVALTMLYNGLECLGAGWEARKLAAGVVLGSVVLCEAVLEARERRTRGQRRELLEELERMVEPDEDEDERNDAMNPRKDNTALAIVCVTAIACTAMVTCFTMYLLHTRQPVVTLAAAAAPAAAATQEVDISGLKSGDGQPLILPSVAKAIPARPADPAALPEDSAGHWYDMEYSGWGVGKLNIPKSPGTGPRGKNVVYLKAVDHPYQTAMVAGMEKVARAYGINLRFKTGNNDINIQAQQVDQVINERPDLVIVSPVDSQACVPLFRKLNEAGIPVICINLLPATEAHKYILAWTGPDDWGQFRLLARDFARRMNNEGSYCIVQHRPGCSAFFSRSYAPLTELKAIAPKMKCLVMQTTDLESEKTKDVVSGWITRFGPELKGIISCDDSGTQVGINEAVKNANREDIIRVSAGNSKVGMDFIKEGRLHAVTYQPPEADGAIPMQLAADWFAGKPIDPIRYLPQAIVTRDNVDQYLPAQW